MWKPWPKSAWSPTTSPRSRAATSARRSASSPSPAATSFTAAFGTTTAITFCRAGTSSTPPVAFLLTAATSSATAWAVQYLTATDSRSFQYTIRIDHELRPGKDRLYGYFYRLKASTITPGIRPDFLRPSPTFGVFGNLVYSRTISPTTLNEVRLVATRFIGHYCAPKDPKDPIGGGLSCPDMLNKQVPGINITGLGTVRDVNLLPGGFFPTEYQLKDTFTTIRGSHAVKVGGELRRAINILWHTASFIPVYTFAS